MDIQPGVIALGAIVILAGCKGGGSRNAAAGDTSHTAPPSVRYEQLVAAGGALPPAGELKNPLEGDAGAAKAGEMLFATMNCDGCHGGGAVGFVGPSLVDGRWRYGASDGALYQTVFYGRPRGMPAYGGVMSPNSIWQIVTYLRSQPVPKNVPTQAW